MRNTTISILVLLCLWMSFIQSRSFYCIGNNCVTVWGKWIIPGRYHGLWRPSDNYIEVIKSTLVTIYICENTPNIIYARNQDDEHGGEIGFKITNRNCIKTNIIIYDPALHDELLYQDNAQRFNDVRKDVNFIDIDMIEDYAEDKTGKFL